MSDLRIIWGLTGLQSRVQVKGMADLTCLPTCAAPTGLGDGFQGSAMARWLRRARPIPPISASHRASRSRQRRSTEANPAGSDATQLCFDDSSCITPHRSLSHRCASPRLDLGLDPLSAAETCDRHDQVAPAVVCPPSLDAPATVRFPEAPSSRPPATPVLLRLHQSPMPIGPQLPPHLQRAAGVPRDDDASEADQDENFGPSLPPHLAEMRKQQQKERRPSRSSTDDDKGRSRSRSWSPPGTRSPSRRLPSHSDNVGPSRAVCPEAPSPQRQVGPQIGPGRPRSETRAIGPARPDPPTGDVGPSRAHGPARGPAGPSRDEYVGFLGV